MNATAMIADLARRGVSLWLNGDELLFDGPNGSADESLLAWLRASRAEIVAVLQSTEKPVADDRPRNLPRDSGRCANHIDPADWQDGRPRAGMVRTTCRRCGSFVGYRPAERKTPTRRAAKGPAADRSADRRA